MLKKLLLSVAVCSALSANANAESWIITNLKGYSASGYNQYKFQPDGYDNRFTITITSNAAVLVNSNVKICNRMSAKSMVCEYGTDTQIWFIDIKARKVMMAEGSHTLDGNIFNRVSTFVGDIAPLN